MLTHPARALGRPIQHQPRRLVLGFRGDSRLSQAGADQVARRVHHVVMRFDHLALLIPPVESEFVKPTRATREDLQLAGAQTVVDVLDAGLDGFVGQDDVDAVFAEEGQERCPECAPLRTRRRP